MSIDGWSVETVGACLAPVPLPSAHKLQTSDYRAFGKYPVIDQGQSFIAGWTDDDAAVISTPLPLIVFGDHTRAFKFVEVPFVRGADGTQILKPRAGIDPLFFYYACLAIDLPSRGYNRHFTILKNEKINLPLNQEQKAISWVLRRVENSAEVQNRQLRAAEALKRAAMRELFTRGLRGETLRVTEIGLLPELWHAGRLDRHADVVSTRMTYSELEAASEPEAGDRLRVLGVKVADMNRPGNEVALREAELDKMLAAAIVEQRCAPPDTIIFPKRGAAIATNKKRLSTEWTVFDPNVIGVIARDKIDQSFLFHWFQGFDLREITEPGPTPQLNKKNLEPLVIPIPPTLDEQREIAGILDAIDRKIDLHLHKKAVLGELFRTLLHQLMAGELRAAEFDFSAPAGSVRAKASA